MSKIKNYFIFMIIALIAHPFITYAQNIANPQQNQAVAPKIAKKTANKATVPPKPLQAISPLELDLGMINIDTPASEGSFAFKNTGSAAINWSTDGPDGWENPDNQKISGVLKNGLDYLHVEIRLLPKEALSGENKPKSVSGYNYVEMKLDAGAEKILCRKELPSGMHKETVKINTVDGPKTVFVTFIIGYIQKTPLINLYPARLDMGGILPGKSVSKKIMATNSGKEMLTWSVVAQKHIAGDKPFNSGRYISFANDDARGSGVYAVPARLKETFEFAGKWMESDGYPTGAEADNSIKIHFNGTGIILYLLNAHEDANISVSLDKHPIENNDLFKEKEKRNELLIAKDLVYGPHVLTIISKNSRLGFEGVKILGESLSYFPEGSIKIMPISGAITRQTNYLTVSLNTAQMPQGYYINDIVFNTNGGEAVVEIFAEVLPDTIIKVIDIYRYYNGKDYLYTANPQGEANRLTQNNYVKEGIAFRLFNPDTPGTTCFNRWYNPQSRGHFYHYDPAGAKKDLRGYIFEGSIGNIATSKLTNTRELYRWYNARTGCYFYSTDLQGGKINKKTYRFDGIAGYVR